MAIKKPGAAGFFYCQRLRQSGKHHRRDAGDDAEKNPLEMAHLFRRSGLARELADY